MAEYQIEEAQLRVEDPTRLASPTEGVSLAMPTMTGYRGVLASAIMKSLGLYGFVTKTKEGPQLKLFGRSDAIRTGMYMFEYLVTEIERLAWNAWNVEKEHTEANGKTWKHSFRLGAAGVIYTRMTEDAKAREVATKIGVETGNTALIVLRDDALEVKRDFEKMTSNMKMRKLQTAGARDRDAYSQGRDAGSKVSLGGGTARLGAAPGKITD
jgi:hypothetical protein